MRQKMIEWILKAWEGIELKTIERGFEIMLPELNWW